MNPYFRKFDIDIPKFDKNFIYPRQYRRLVNSEYTSHGINYSSIGNRILYLRLMNFFEYLQPDNVSYVEIKDEEVIAPHRDHDNIITCINYYFETGGARTSFFESIDDSKRYSLPGETQKQMYDIINAITPDKIAPQ